MQETLLNFDYVGYEAAAVDILAAFMCVFGMQCITIRHRLMHTQRFALGVLAVTFLWNGLGGANVPWLGWHRLPSVATSASTLLFLTIFCLRGWSARYEDRDFMIENQKQPSDYIKAFVVKETHGH
jgi:hypothetical protein